MNEENLKKDFYAIAQFGMLKKGGVSRIAFSKEDMTARKYLGRIMEAEGLSVSIDSVGNIRGKRPGQKDLSPVIMGSHLDTVPFGGHYDGTIGVLGGLAVIREMNKQQIKTARPVEVMNLSCEESSRFSVGTVGSKILAGSFPKDQLKQRKDADGKSVYDAMTLAGYAPEAMETAILSPDDIHAFIELHIEQGLVLESENKAVGIVTDIAAPTRFKVVIEGRADHSGNTPMNLRKDALTGACELILGVENITTNKAGPHTVGTVGFATIEPGVMNVIPGRVEIGIDIRDIHMKDKEIALKKLLKLMDNISTQRGLVITHEIISHEAPVPLSDKIIQILEKEAHTMGILPKKMISGGGHDAMNMARITDAGLIFVPSIRGISHNMAEKTDFKDIMAGCKLMYRSVIQLANQG